MGIGEMVDSEAMLQLDDFIGDQRQLQGRCCRRAMLVLHLLWYLFHL